MVFWIIFVLNLVFPVIYGALATKYSLKAYRGETINHPGAFIIPFCGIGLLQLISFVFLFIGLHKIRKHILLNGFIGDFNHRVVYLHAFCLVLYSIVGVMLYGIYFYYLSPDPAKHANAIMVVQTVCLLFNFSAELTLVVIFVHIGSPKVPQYREKS